jgi:hypothetical protein
MEAFEILKVVFEEQETGRKQVFEWFTTSTSAYHSGCLPTSKTDENFHLGKNLSSNTEKS